MIGHPWKLNYQTSRVAAMYQIPFGRVIRPTVHTELDYERTCETCNSPMAPNVEMDHGRNEETFLVKAVP